jgi:tetratricopeptide (TPR) repeat protein
VESGAFDEATRLYEQAREIAESADQVDDQLTAQQWFNLGIVQVELGDHERAIRCFKQSVHCAPDAPTMELRRGRYLQGWAEVLLDQDDADRAVKVAREAVKVSREIGSATLRRDANYVLAMALLQRHVLDDDPEALEAARLAVDASCEFSPGTRGHAAFALRGLIALRRGRREDAMDGFLKAERFGRTALEHGARNYSALDSRGLALAGLALLARTRLDDGDGLQLAMALQLRVDDSRELSELAVQAYREARTISSHSGVVRRVGRQLDALPDPDGILAGVRSVAVSPPLAGDDSARISG